MSTKMNKFCTNMDSLILHGTIALELKTANILQGLTLLILIMNVMTKSLNSCIQMVIRIILKIKSSVP